MPSFWRGPSAAGSRASTRPAPAGRCCSAWPRPRPCRPSPCRCRAMLLAPRGFRHDWRRGIWVMLSTPPPIATSAPSCMISWAAIAIACRPGRAEAVDRRAGDRRRQPGADGGHAGDVHPLLTFRVAAADDHVFDLGRIELRRPASTADAVGDHVVRPRHIERTAERFRQRVPVSARHWQVDGFTLITIPPEAGATLAPGYVPRRAG